MQEDDGNVPPITELDKMGALLAVGGGQSATVDDHANETALKKAAGNVRELMT